MPETPTSAPNTTDVYAIHGADPEVLAYAMAKYSRSALSMRESLRQISSQRAEEFLNTFYFQYGHRSIADLAHVAFAIERLSLLAAIDLVDEPRWDGQERSTRYQDFTKSGWYTPTFAEPTHTHLFTATAEHLFNHYQAIGNGMLTELIAATPRPSDMQEDAYQRILKARAFDMARYLLPLATNTSLGQITNARTLEGQISRLLTSEYQEVRDLGHKLRDAATGPAWNLTHEAARALHAEIAALDPALATQARDHLLREVHTAPTLVKYTAPSEYELRSRASLFQAAAELMGATAIAPAPAVDLIDTPAGEHLTLEIDLATSLLYPHTHYSYRQLRQAVASLTGQQIAELITLGTAHRGRYDELPRPFAAAQGFRFDILMDIGGFRDLHRHRRCTQLLQPYTTRHGYDTPDFPGQPQLTGSPVHTAYIQAIQQAFSTYAALAGTAKPSLIATPALSTPPHSLRGDRFTNTGENPPVETKREAYSAAPVPIPQFNSDGSLNLQWGNPLPPADPRISTGGAPTDPSFRPERSGVEKPAFEASAPNPDAAYILPLATRRRALFTMDFAEALYIAELRSTPAGHYSYRNIAWQMYQAIARQHPALAKHIRIQDVTTPIDLLKR